MEFNLTNLVRSNILAMNSYSSARDEYTGHEGVFLDANENPFPSAVNRYPDPYQRDLKEELAIVKRVQTNQIIVGNGSDEILDLLFRAFCVPGKDKVVTIKPTYGMYNVLAQTNDVQIIEVPLDPDFNLDGEAILASAEGAKMIVLCSPNNPTGNLLNRNVIIDILTKFNGLVVIDEAYIDFSNGKTFLQELNNFPNLFVSQTLSKAYGMAGIRVGLGFGNVEVVDILNKLKPPYNVNELSQTFALARLRDVKQVAEEVLQILLERSRVLAMLQESKHVERIYRTDANFILFRVANADDLYQHFARNQVVVRNRTKQFCCENCLRVSIGTHEENERFIQVLNEYDDLEPNN
ncbi:MAG: histidinol-phosphate transaminase [Crocinitomicaceae bacterium]|nr:histidinol-phosphate transaminase [Crocinitomicaceae bacterium]